MLLEKSFHHRLDHRHKFDEIGQLLKREKYDDLLKQLDVNYFPPVDSDFEKLKTMMQDLDKQYGRTGGFKLVGFEFRDYTIKGEKQRLFTMYSLLTRQRTQALVALTLNTSASITTPNIAGLNL